MNFGPSITSTPQALRGRQSLPEPTVSSLLEILFQATSPNTVALAQATDSLADLESHPSFWVCLLGIAFERQVHLDASRLARERASIGLQVPVGGLSQDVLDKRWSAIRSLAIIRFKLGVEKYWRSRVVNRVTITIPSDTKDKLRQGLLRCLEEPDRSVAIQACVAIARIARHDFPSAWPSLFDELQRAMVDAHARLGNESSITHTADAQDPARTFQGDLNRLTLLRAADVCQKALKELGSVRILAGKIRMTELSQQLLPTLVPMFQQYFAETLPSQGIDLESWSRSPFLAERIRTSQLLLKSVSVLAVADTGTLSRNSTQAADPERQNFAQQFFLGTPAMLQYVRDARWAFIDSLQDPPSQATEAILRALQKHLLTFGKLYLGLLGREKSKSVTWSGWGEVVLWYWQQAREATSEELSITSKSTEDEERSLMHKRPFKLIVQAMLLLKQSLEEWKKTMSMPAAMSDEQMVADITETLVEKLMLLTNDDLQLWEQDAEDWAVAEEAETYNMDVRPAAERTLMVLANTAPKSGSTFVGRIIWQKLEQLPPPSSALTLDDVLKREALYTALGRCRDNIPYEKEVLSQAVASRFVPEASLEPYTGPTWVIVRRRIAWLIWEWSELMTPGDRPAIYNLLVTLLQGIPGKTDAAVRLAAARSLAALADALEFDTEAFQPFIDASLSRLAALSASSELHEMDSIRTCTNTMSILIERLGARVAPHLEQLASLVPTLWTLDDTECKARPSIIVFVGRLVRSVELIPTGSQGASTSLHGLVEVIVRDSLHPNNSPLLGKDALELWIRALRSSSQMTDPLFRLVGALPGLIGQPDFCPEACRVAQEATLTAAEPIIAQYGHAIFEEFAHVIGDPQSPVILHPLAAMDTMVQALHTQAVDPMLWATLMDQSGLFLALLGSLLKVKDTSVVIGYFVALLARIAFIMKDTGVFIELVRATAYRLEGPQCRPGQDVIKPLIEMSCARVENMASMRKRKITCMGLAGMLAGTAKGDEEMQAAVLETLPAMVGVWMDYMGDIRQDGSEDVSAPGCSSGSLPSLPVAPPSSPQLSRANVQAPEPIRRSPSPALSIPGLEGLDEEDEFTETSPGRARMTELNRMDLVNTIALTSLVRECLRSAQGRSGAALETAFANMDPLVVELFQKDLTR